MGKRGHLLDRRHHWNFPKLSTYHRIAYQAGYVLAVEITRSPLGPYMVQGYGDWRYYIRSGSRTEPMSEQQVRDAYMFAARAREQREDVWKTHLLPLNGPQHELRELVRYRISLVEECAEEANHARAVDCPRFCPRAGKYPGLYFLVIPLSVSVEARMAVASIPL